jgi:hypothetical protein
MPHTSPVDPAYSFENDVSGRLFCWLIESGKIEFGPMIEHAVRDDAGQDKAIKRLAKALEPAVLADPDWDAEAQRIAAGWPAPKTWSKAPGYRLWFRPAPSKSIKFKEVARALLVFAGRLPPAVT